MKYYNEPNYCTHECVRPYILKVYKGSDVYKNDIIFECQECGAEIPEDEYLEMYAEVVDFYDREYLNDIDESKDEISPEKESDNSFQ